MLERIKQKRQAAYEAKLAEWEAEVKAWEEGGKVGKKPTKPKKPKELPPLSEEELDALPKLPEGWMWIKIDKILSSNEKPMTTGPFGTALSKKDHKEKGVPVLGIESIENGKFTYKNKIFVSSEKAQELFSYKVKSGDIVISRSGTVGELCVIPKDFPEALISTNLIKLSMNKKVMIPEFFVYMLIGNQNIKEQIREKCKGSTRDFLNQTILYQLVFPLVPINEQYQILRKLEFYFEKLNKEEEVIDRAFKKAESLRQSILKSAFEGRLVSHKTENTLLFNSPSKPLNIEGINPTDLHAGIIALSYKMHQDGGYLDKLNHVKHEKIAHMVESVVGIDLGRAPVQDAAGPADFNHLKKVEHRAQKANWFTTEKEKIGYRYKPLPGFDKCVARTKEALGEHLETVEWLIELMLPMSMESAEIFATTYAAWNNMLMDGVTPTDEEIVSKAREEWSARKQTLERERFFKALEWMREKGIVPRGTGKYVRQKKK